VSAIARFLGRTSGALALACALVCACSSPTHHFTSTSPLVTLTQISRDPYTNKTSQHQTEVEPDTFFATLGYCQKPETRIDSVLLPA
jgi:hypothetical protein